MKGGFCDGTRARARSSASWIKRLFTRRVRASEGRSDSSFPSSKVGPFPCSLLAFNGWLQTESAARTIIRLILSRSLVSNEYHNVTDKWTPSHMCCVARVIILAIVVFPDCLPPPRLHSGSLRYLILSEYCYCHPGAKTVACSINTGTTIRHYVGIP